MPHLSSWHSPYHQEKVVEKDQVFTSAKRGVHILHIQFWLTYFAYFGKYFNCLLTWHILPIFFAYSAYFLNILCHILCIVTFIFVCIYCIFYILICIFFAYSLHILCIFYCIFYCIFFILCICFDIFLYILCILFCILYCISLTYYFADFAYATYCAYF